MKSPYSRLTRNSSEHCDAPPRRVGADRSGLQGSTSTARVPERLLNLQRTAGNRTVNSVLAQGPMSLGRPWTIQRQLDLKEGTRVNVTVGGSSGKALPAVITAIVPSQGSVPLKYTVRFDDDSLNAGERTYDEALVNQPSVAWKSTRFKLTPDVIAKLDEIADGATKLSELSEEQLRSMIDVLAPVDTTKRVPKPKVGQKAQEPERKPLNDAVGGFVPSLQKDLVDAQKNESEEVAAVREQTIEKDIEALKDDAFKKSFNVSPSEAKFADLEPALTGLVPAGEDRREQDRIRNRLQEQPNDRSPG